MTESGPQPSNELQKLERETGVSYDPNENTVEYVGEKNDTEHFVEFVEYLFSNNFISRSDIPYTPVYKEIRYLLNESPTHQDGRDMIRPKKVADEVYLETNHDSKSKKRYTKRMIEDLILD